MTQKNDPNGKQPLAQLFNDERIRLKRGEFGSILARAGVGKTAFLVQIALNNLLNHKNVLHVSLGEPVQKVSLWYEEVFRRITDKNDSIIIHDSREKILTHRFIMTFQAEDFNAAKLNERIGDLAEQAIFHPQIVLIDGMDFDDSPDRLVEELRPLAKSWKVGIWFTGLVHRDATSSASTLPEPPDAIVNLFDTAVLLEPNEKIIHVRMLKNPRNDEHRSGLALDPRSMLILDQWV